MQRRTPIGRSCALLFVLLTAILITACTSEPRSLVLGYKGEAPATPVAEAIVEVLQRHNINVRLERPFESLAELTAAVEGGAVDFAMLGEPLKPNKNLQMLQSIMPRVLHVVHHKSMGRPTLQQLLSAESIYAGAPNSIGREILSKLAAHYRVTPMGDRLLDTPWVPAPGGPPQVYFIFGPLLSAEARLGFADYNLFSFDEDSGSSATSLTLLYPNLKSFTLPAGIYPDLTEKDISTLSVEDLLVARPDFDDELAYGIIDALHEESQPIAEAYSLSRESLTASMTDETRTLVMHSGAWRFVDKDAPSLLERYAEVFALFATVLLGLGTVLTAWLRQRRQRRKDRLDEYFLQLHSLRDRLKKGAQIPPDSTEIDHLEAEVLQLLVEERLAVDSALVAFFLMTESVRREAARPSAAG